MQQSSSSIANLASLGQGPNRLGQSGEIARGDYPPRWTFGD